MKTTGLVTVLLLSLSPAIAQAYPARGLNKLLKTLPIKSPTAMLPNCTDFSGSWVGTCNNSDGSTDNNQTTVIAQTDCRSLTMDGQDVEIGGTNRVGATSFVDGSSYDATISYSWNASRTQLAGPISISLLVNTWGSSGTTGLTTMALEDGRLHTTDHFVGTATTGNFPGFVSTDCVYTKAN